MLPDRIQSSRVVVGIIDGHTSVGTLARFSPYTPDLSLHPQKPSAGRDAPPPGKPKMLRAESVAYVAFEKVPGSPPRVPLATDDRIEFRVHVAGGQVFTVHAVPAETAHPLGMYATPSQADSPFEEIFFYTHGINACENLAPIGGMLVDAGKLGAQDLERGITAQVTERTKPIGEILIEQKKVDPQDIEQATVLQKRSRMRLGEVLVEMGTVSAKDIEVALAEQQRRKGKRLGEVLVEMKMVTEVALAETLAQKFNLPFKDLSQCKIDPAASREVPEAMVRKYGILPLETTPRQLTIAISDPLLTEIVDVLRIDLKKRIQEIVVAPSQLRQAVAAYLARAEDKLAADERSAEQGRLASLVRQLETDEGAVGVDEEDAPESEGSDAATIIKLTNHIIADAYQQGASDVHIEPNGNDRPTVVRFRIDGECVAYQELPASVRNQLVARIKIMARLDISEKRKPQDGKIRFRLGSRQIELRVATIPTVNGNEDIVLRILAASKPLPLAQIGMNDRNLQELNKVITKPYGLILCVGPTGSGKTTTLHSILGAINTVDMKIWTAEDPVEITQAGLRQVQIHPKIGFTFAAAMRAFLRADPDVIMVGEMRDAETAGTAVEASLTGHLVFSTLHTNTAPETVTRLLDMGLDSFSFADALLGVLAQRLARGLCKNCRESYQGSQDDYDELAKLYGHDAFESAVGLHSGSDLRLWRARGCEACVNTGYKGRLALHELLIADDTIKAAVSRKAPVEEIRRTAMESGMTTLMQDGIAKLMTGLTDLKQVLAVCSR